MIKLEVIFKLLTIVMFYCSIMQVSGAHEKDPVSIKRKVSNNGPIVAKLLGLLSDFVDKDKKRYIDQQTLLFENTIQKLKALQQTPETKEFLEIVEEDSKNVGFFSYPTDSEVDVKKLDEEKQRILFEQIYVTMPLEEIEQVYGKFQVIPLRRLDKDCLILGCGNEVTELFSKQGLLYHGGHSDADTIDISVLENPSIVANFDLPGVFDYIANLGKTYKSVIEESRFNLDGARLEYLRKILAVGGNYRSGSKSFAIHIIAKSFENLAFNYIEQSQERPILVIDDEEYEKLSKLDGEELYQQILVHLIDFYKLRGFELTKEPGKKIVKHAVNKKWTEIHLKGNSIGLKRAR